MLMLMLTSHPLLPMHIPLPPSPNMIPLMPLTHPHSRLRNHIHIHILCMLGLQARGFNVSCAAPLD